MILAQVRRLIMLVLMSLLPLLAAALDEPHTLRLLGHSSLDENGPPVVLGTLTGTGCVSAARCGWGFLRPITGLSN